MPHVKRGGWHTDSAKAGTYILVIPGVKRRLRLFYTFYERPKSFAQKDRFSCVSL